MEHLNAPLREAESPLLMSELKKLDTDFEEFLTSLPAQDLVIIQPIIRRLYRFKEDLERFVQDKDGVLSNNIVRSWIRYTVNSGRNRSRKRRERCGGNNILIVPYKIALHFQCPCRIQEKIPFPPRGLGIRKRFTVIAKGSDGKFIHKDCGVAVE